MKSSKTSQRTNSLRAVMKNEKKESLTEFFDKIVNKGYKKK